MRPEINPASLAFDFDGVVADTMGLFLSIAREEYGFGHLRYEDITCYNLWECLDMPSDILMEILDRLLKGDYTQRFDPIVDAPNVLKRTARSAGRICFVTARHDPGPMPEWISDNIGLSVDEMEIVTTGDFKAKISALQTRHITHFVEDRLETCHLLADENITPILYVQPWNREPHPFSEVNDWRTLENMIDFNDGR